MKYEETASIQSQNSPRSGSGGRSTAKPESLNRALCTTDAGLEALMQQFPDAVVTFEDGSTAGTAEAGVRAAGRRPAPDTRLEYITLEKQPRATGWISTLHQFDDGYCEGVFYYQQEPFKHYKRGKRVKKERTAIDPVFNEMSNRRAKTKIRRLCHALGADRLLTLTFRENIDELKEAWRSFKLFVQYFNRMHAHALAYIAVPERQKRGAWHFHLAIKGFHNVNVLRHLWRRAAGDGNIDITNPVKHEWKRKSLSRYISKYVSKLMDVPAGSKRYSSSKGIVWKRTVNFHPSTWDPVYQFI
jgi:hypothetical protein